LGLNLDIGKKDGYEKCEQFYRDVAHDAGMEGWELDRLIFNYKSEIIESL
jgi:hypothetical protein